MRIRPFIAGSLAAALVIAPISISARRLTAAQTRLQSVTSRHDQTGHDVQEVLDLRTT